MIKKLIRYGLKGLAWIIGVIMVMWVILWIYVELNEDRLIQKISSTVHNRTKGEVDIRTLSVSFFRTFPLLSLQLSDVTIRDSLFTRHKKDLLKASDIYLRVSIPGLIFSNSPVGKVIIRHGSINIITDSAGYTNQYVFKAGKAEDPDKNTFRPDLVLRNVSISFVNPLRNKNHQAIVRNLKCSTKDRNGNIMIDVSLNMLVKNLSFNTLKGAYLKEKLLSGDFDLVFEKKAKNLMVDNIKLNIDGVPFYLEGVFNFIKHSPDYFLNIRTPHINFSKAVSFFTDTIQKKLKVFSFVKPVSLNIKLSGKTLYRFVPLVKVTLSATDNNVITPNGMFENCTFTAFYTNEKVAGEKRIDENSVIHIKNFSGQWEKIKLASKSMMFSNLKKPFLECDLKSDVDMKSLNSLSGSSTLHFLSGKLSVDIQFRGPINGDDSTASNINGDINFSNAGIKYLPRDFTLSDCDGSLKFVNNDLIVPKLTANAGNTRLIMKGSANNFLSLLNVSPEKLALHWKVSSPELHLQDFKAFLSKAESKKENKKASLGTATSKVDKMFSDGDVFIDMETPEMDYKTFKATNVKANVVFKSTEIKLENISLNHAGGSMQVSGTMKNGVQSNPLSLQTQMNGMDIPRLFTAFNNFGQDAITNKNLKGRLSANVNFHTAITNNATLVTDASEGTIHFLLENGELNNFEPLLKIGEKAFKKQDFSQIRFADLKNKLEVKGTSFIVNEMEIRSTALNFFVEGVYDFKKGTDMSIKLPLRNLMKSQANTDLSDEAKTKKGVSLRLRAKTGDDGKLKVSWDPFRLAVKNKEEVKDSQGPRN